MWWRQMGCALVLAGCTVAGGEPATAPSSSSAAVAPDRGMVRAGTPDEVNIAKARALGRQQLFSWSEWSDEAFARAKAEGRFILIHGAAEWCHWCHVMEETTYRDPEVGKILRDRFVTIRVDIDSRPDVEERYEDYGWPATILLDAEARELGKYRGYMSPSDFLEVVGALDTVKPEDRWQYSPRELPAPLAALPWVATQCSYQLDSYYDSAGGGWGMRQKAPIGEAASFELRRFEKSGDEAALGRALFSLEQHARLIDPVWGGIYQYSTGGRWDEAHYEKLMTFQAANLTAYAEAYRLKGDARMLGHARAIERYLGTFLSNAEGAFLVAQDADVGAHDHGADFVDGDVYYRLDDAGRRKLGIPRVDDHVYGEENGLAIAALAVLYRATRDGATLARAEKAAALVLASHVDDKGRVKHDAKSDRQVWYLADAGSFGLALALLAEVKGGDAGYLAAAQRIAAWIDKDLAAGDGTFFGHTVDSGAAGVFERRRQPHVGNVYAARLFAALARLTGKAAYLDKAKATLAALARPSALAERGRMIGGYLLALDEAGAVDWKAGSP